MHLQYHFRLQLFGTHSLIYIYHSQFNHIGSRTLNGGINSSPLGIATHYSIGGIDIAQPNFTTHNSFGIARLLRHTHPFVHIAGDARKFGFIILNNLFGFAPADAQIGGKSEGTLTVNDAKVYAFGLVALLFSHLFQWQAIDLSGSSRMDIEPIFEGRNHIFISTAGSNNAQFYLRIIGAE